MSEIKKKNLLSLPDTPGDLRQSAVRAWRQPVSLQTYLPGIADRNPLFLEKRVYQGSSGRVYPLPVIDNITTEPVQYTWDAIHLENEYLRFMVLPDLGGRIHIGLDKTNGYDFFYRQNVIKPALVGLAGPWASGGVEFNWPQHHRPGTYLPVATEIEHHNDGSVTVWCGDIDRMSGLKGMHGLCLRPDSSLLELRVRLYNRMPQTETFLWWANVGVHVHEQYQSFFPTDVRYVADHARRAITTFPLSTGTYYGVDYASRAVEGVPKDQQPQFFQPDGSYPANDLSWYANIPVPTSYMVLQTKEDFCGGYDHQRQAGLVQFANHHIAPGKKQWTWGNHEFGYAWDRNLTEEDGPYIELMTGAYTDNQPDFSFLAPWETKSFSQFWYPIQRIGTPIKATRDAALSLSQSGNVIRCGICVTRNFDRIHVELWAHGVKFASHFHSIKIGDPLIFEEDLPSGSLLEQVIIVLSSDGRELVRAQLPSSELRATVTDHPNVATEPPLPADVVANDELNLIGIHLQQYRHATRRPEHYWTEALRRDQNDYRANLAMAGWHLQRGEFEVAEQMLRRSIARLTTRNPNPPDGEPFYTLGLVLRHMGRIDDAYDAFYKATWNAAWSCSAFQAVAEIDASRHQWNDALDHIQSALRVNLEHCNGRNLATAVLKELGLHQEAQSMLRETRRIDPLDSWSRFLQDGHLPNGGYASLFLAFDLMRCGFYRDALKVLVIDSTPLSDGSVPLMHYARAVCFLHLDDIVKAKQERILAKNSDPTYCFPNSIELMSLLQSAIASDPDDAKACFYLGNFLYDRRRHSEAIELWERSVEIDGRLPTAWRNLGVGYFNVLNDADRADSAYERAFNLDRTDARVLYEHDQLWKRIGTPADKRLHRIEQYPNLIAKRDDLAIERITLLNQMNRPQEAMQQIMSRHFQAWEGGEGVVLTQYTRAYLMLGKTALQSSDSDEAIQLFLRAFESPVNLGEARHLLTNQSETYFWLGLAYTVNGQKSDAEAYLRLAAKETGDFQQMALQQISSATFWRGMALQHLGENKEAATVMQSILRFSEEKEAEDPKIDYFATSLPTLLLFEEDLKLRNHIEALFLRVQALFGLGQREESSSLLRDLLRLDPNHIGALELKRLLESSLVLGRL